jgi:hypothetical protein
MCMTDLQVLVAMLTAKAGAVKPAAGAEPAATAPR